MQNNIIKICCAIPTLIPGGMERVMSVLVNGFVNYPNTEVHLLLYGKGVTIFYDLDKRVIIHRPTFHFSDSHRSLSTLRSMCYLRKTVKTITPDAVLSFGEYFNSFVLLSTIGLRVPIYVSDRSSPNVPMGRIHRWLRKILYPRAAGVIAQTQIAKEIYSKIYTPKSITVIGNPIRHISQIEKVEQSNTIISVGRLIKTKHYDRLIRIFNQIGRTDWNLMIVGGDAQKQNQMVKLEALLKELGQPKNIILAGNRSDVDELLLKSRIFVFTSSSEGFPNAIGEALSAGLPVVAYDCVAGPSDMVHNGENGYLIPLFEDEVFIQKLNHLMNNPEERERMGKKSLEYALDYSEEAICKQYYQFITRNK